MQCPRCQGLMPVMSEFDEATQQDFDVYLCINCGERLDPTILRNRRAQKESRVEPH